MWTTSKRSSVSAWSMGWQLGYPKANFWFLRLNFLGISSTPTGVLLWTSTPLPSPPSLLCQTSLLSRGSWVWSTSTENLSKGAAWVLALLTDALPSPEPRLFSHPFRSWSILALILQYLSLLMLPIPTWVWFSNNSWKVPGLYWLSTLRSSLTQRRNTPPSTENSWLSTLLSTFTDHKTLTHALFRVSLPWSACQQRHLSYLAEFTSSVVHVPGPENIVADALSRPSPITSQSSSTLVSPISPSQLFLSPPFSEVPVISGFDISLLPPLQITCSVCSSPSHCEVSVPLRAGMLLYDSSTGFLQPLVPL